MGLLYGSYRWVFHLIGATVAKQVTHQVEENLRPGYFQLERKVLGKLQEFKVKTVKIIKYQTHVGPFVRSHAKFGCLTSLEVNHLGTTLGFL